MLYINKIQINDGFTVAEVLKMNTEKLPIEAKRIHEECKGMPRHIIMFAAHFEEFEDGLKIHTTR